MTIPNTRQLLSQFKLLFPIIITIALLIAFFQAISQQINGLGIAAICVFFILSTRKSCRYL